MSRQEAVMADSHQILPADPKANYLAHKEEIDQAIRVALDRGWYILGNEVSLFEKEFASYIGVPHAVGVGSGTDAIQLALRVLGIGPGDAVLTVSHTSVATVAAIELAGATPVFVDIDPVTYTMDVRALETAIADPRSSRLKAIIPVHLYGNPANMPAIAEIAEKHGLYLIEDCAQAHGAMIAGRKAGSWGHMGAFSFYPTKNLGALGDGGALVCSDETLAAKAGLIRQYGWRERYISEMAGMNTRLDELQAAVLRVKLRHLDAENGRRQEIAKAYDAALETSGSTLPRSAADATHVYHQYTILTPRRDELASFLKSEGINAAILYPSPVHLQPAYRGRVNAPAGGLPVSERVCRELLCLPMHPQLGEAQVRRIIDQVRRWIG
jgi:dTDP-4-amino-4,6-dideoxygalactose transaminase